MTKDYETVVNYLDSEINFAAALHMMDDDIREELHIQLRSCEPQLFFDEYCKKHFEKYGQEFLLDDEGRIVWQNNPDESLRIKTKRPQGVGYKK